MAIFDFAEKVQKIMWAAVLIVSVTAGALAFLLANAYLGMLQSVGISVATVVVMLFVPLPWHRLEKQITFMVAKQQRLQIMQYESTKRGVSYFLLADDIGVRYYHGIGALGQMQVHDFLNEDEFATLKSGKTLPY